MKEAHVEASQVIPSLCSSPVFESVPKKVAGNSPKDNLLENSLKEDNDRFSQILEKIDLKGVQSWTAQQQQSVKELLKEYQHLFALNLKKLGKTSLVQHDINLDEMTLFKEQYRRIPPHQYEEVRKHLQEMLYIGAICRSTSPWAGLVVLDFKKDGRVQFFIDLRKLNN